MMTIAPGELDQLNLSAAMCQGSRSEHERAEGSVFMGELLAGRVNEQGYAAYLLRLRPVYAALESVPRALGADPYVEAVLDPALDRLAAIDADLEVWAGGRHSSVDSPAAAAYVGRVVAAGAWGGLFAAHHYVRYLGDLSGGQAIGRILDREFGLGGRGIAFYDFAAVGRPKPYKDAYRSRLDALRPSAEDTRRIIEEVRAAFALNQAIFAELGEQLESFRR